jgi:hypothetical protein
VIPLLRREGTQMAFMMSWIVVLIASIGMTCSTSSDRRAGRAAPRKRREGTAMAAIGGVGIVVAALALLYQFRPSDGQAPKRPEWIDVTIVIAVTSGITFGVMLIVVGLAGWFS